jgi:hypothetical protein
MPTPAFFFKGHDDIKVRFSIQHLQHIPYARDHLEAFPLPPLAPLAADTDEYVMWVPGLSARTLLFLRNVLEAVVLSEVNLSVMTPVTVAIPGLPEEMCDLPTVSYTASWLAAIPGWPSAFLSALASFAAEDLLELFETTSYLGMWDLRAAVGHRILWRLCARFRGDSDFESVEDELPETEFASLVEERLSFAGRTMLLHLLRKQNSAT